MRKYVQASVSVQLSVIYHTTLLSQLSLACRPGLTEGGNVNFVPGKFRSDDSGTSMRPICVVSVNKRADVPRRDIQRLFFSFAFLF